MVQPSAPLQFARPIDLELPVFDDGGSSTRAHRNLSTQAFVLDRARLPRCQPRPRTFASGLQPAARNDVPSSSARV